MFKVNDKATRTTRRSGVFIVNFKHISRLFLLFLLLNLGRQMPAGTKHVTVSESF